jgi:hypothetical protein
MKRTLFIIMAFLTILSAFGQQTGTVRVAKDTTVNSTPKNENAVRKDTRPLKDRIAFGLGSSFWITPGQTFVELDPVLAYRFPKILMAGVGYKYIYRHQRVYGRDLNAWGPDIFARVSLLKRVYFWTEYEFLSNQYLTQVAGQELTINKTTTDSWFAGFGYIRSVGRKGRGGVSIQLLYNFLYNRDVYSPYYSPVTYRVGYYF